jgi:hypothetical protein
MTYELLWRNKFLTINAETIDDMIDTLQGATDELRAMRDAGITLAHGQEDDYATFITEDKELAERFGFWEMEEFFDEEEEEEDDDMSEEELSEEEKYKPEAGF